MKECIEREAALESLCAGCEYVPIEEKEVCPYRFTGCQEYENIFAIPVADVVARDCYDRLLAENDELRKERPVVRCGECKHRTSGNPNCVGRSKDWYCPWGERRQDD